MSARGILVSFNLNFLSSASPGMSFFHSRIMACIDRSLALHLSSPFLPLPLIRNREGKKNCLRRTAATETDMERNVMSKERLSPCMFLDSGVFWPLV